MPAALVTGLTVTLTQNSPVLITQCSYPRRDSQAELTCMAWLICKQSPISDSRY